MSGPAAEHEQSAERWAWVAWGTLVAAAVAVFEVFQQPALLGATLGLKFAWVDARTAWWLKGRDPDRRRGHAHFWTYLGFGLWKAAAAGLILSVALAVIVGVIKDANQNAPNNKPDHELLALIFGGACLSGVFTALAAAVVTCLGLTMAARGRYPRKLWLNSALAAARVRDHWPPDYGDANRLRLVALPSALVVLLVPAGTLFAVAASQLQPGKEAGVWLAAAGTFVVLVGIPALGLLFNDWVKDRLTAGRPEEAWPDEPGDGG